MNVELLPEGVPILAFDVGGTRIKAGIVRGAAVSALCAEPLPERKQAADIIETLVRMGNQLQMGQSVQAVSISMKGIIDPRQGVILDVNESLSDLIGKPLTQSLAQAFQLPVFAENDARLYTVGELLYGAGRWVDNLFCLTLGTGVGCGVAMQRRVLRGVRGLFGTMGGHVTVQVDGPRCTCGNIGCLEAMIGTVPFLKKATERYATSGVPVRVGMTPQDIFTAASHGDGVAGEMVAYYIRYLSAGIVSLIHAYDSDMVILGGGIAGSGHQFLPAVQQYVDEHTWTYPRKRVAIAIATLGDTAALVGGAALARGMDALQ